MRGKHSKILDEATKKYLNKEKTRKELIKEYRIHPQTLYNHLVYKLKIELWDKRKDRTKISCKANKKYYNIKEFNQHIMFNYNK